MLIKMVMETIETTMAETAIEDLLIEDRRWVEYPIMMDQNKEGTYSHSSSGENIYMSDLAR